MLGHLVGQWNSGVSLRPRREREGEIPKTRKEEQNGWDFQWLGLISCWVAELLGGGKTSKVAITWNTKGGCTLVPGALGPSRHACTLMGHGSSRATGTWRNCVSWVLWASGLLSIDQHSKNPFDVLLRSRGGLPIIMIKYISCGPVWWRLKLRQKLTQKMWDFLTSYFIGKIFACYICIKIVIKAWVLYLLQQLKS